MPPKGEPLAAAVSRRGTLFAGVAGLAWAAMGPPALADVVDVDLELLLAVDASGSVSQQRFMLQKQGYELAFRDPRVLRAVRSGVSARIAVSMFQWTGPHMQIEVTPWTAVSDEASAAAFADAIAAVPRRLYGGGTSISGAIDYAAGRFGRGGYKGPRRVIDISGDGANTSGRPVAQARDEALAQGITINGLPILSVEPLLDQHYRDEVIGGPGAFLIAINDYDQFAEAIVRKLVAEIAGLLPQADKGRG